MSLIYPTALSDLAPSSNADGLKLKLSPLESTLPTFTSLINISRTPRSGFVPWISGSFVFRTEPFCGTVILVPGIAVGFSVGAVVGAGLLVGVTVFVVTCVTGLAAVSYTHLN